MKQSLQEKEENEWQDLLFSEGLSIDLRNPSKEASVKARQGISMALSCHEIIVSSSTDVMTNPLYDNNISIKKKWFQNTKSVEVNPLYNLLF